MRDDAVGADEDVTWKQRADIYNGKGKGCTVEDL